MRKSFRGVINERYKGKKCRNAKSNDGYMDTGGVCCGLLIFFFLEIMGGRQGENELKIELLDILLVLVIGVYGGFFLQLIFHEFGHGVFGALTGYRFVSFRIGSFMWIRMDGKLRFKKFSLAGTGGQCLMEPPEMADGKIPFVLYYSGGFIMNLITIPVFAVAAIMTFGVAPRLSLVLLVWGLFGLIVALQNGVPMKTEFISNDGDQIRILKKEPEALQFFWIQLKANAMRAQGYTASEMPEDWFVLPPKEKWTNPLQAAIVIMAAGRLMDQGQFVKAKQIIEELLQNEEAMMGVQRYLLLLEYAFCEMLGEGRQEKIQRCFDEIPERFMKAMRKYPSVIRTCYAYALLQEQNEEKAKDYLRQFEACASTFPYPTEIKEERKQIEYVTQQSERKSCKEEKNE